MSPSSRDAGMIVLKIKRVNRVASRPVDNFQQLAQGPQGTRQSGDIYVGFGEDGPAQERWNYTWGVEPHAEDGPGGATPSTYVSFTFRYRTYEFLQAQGIAQAPPPVRGPSSATRAPVRRISSAPAVSHNESSVATPGSIHRVQRYAHELSAGVPSV
ncbi:hypothetical protein PQX77_006773 [Marasmius sp. AFHP31]|nr:hypothetical protein PQX77_006773 [Marasmius sp. AFHP31]